MDTSYGPTTIFYVALVVFTSAPFSIIWLVIAIGVDFWLNDSVQRKIGAAVDKHRK